MNEKIQRYELELEIERDLLESKKEMLSMSKKGIVTSIATGGTVSTVLILMHDTLNTQIRMYNVISTCFFIVATYWFLMDSIEKKNEYEMKIFASETKIRMLENLIKETRGKNKSENYYK